MERHRDLWLKLLAGAVLLVLCGGGFFACSGWKPSGSFALEFLAAVEGGDPAAIADMIHPWCEEPAGTPPSRPWRDAEILDVEMTDAPDDYDVHLKVTADGVEPTTITIPVVGHDHFPFVDCPVERAIVTVAGEPRDVDFAGTAFPEADATGFGVWVLPGVYELRSTGPSGGTETDLLLVRGDRGGLELELGDG
ncbi:hypothetical protein Pen01_61950 [Phytomonospora endophytica]|nr:hypothetical protein Pen01_61950 [Phytomonospora endophytica]